MSPHPKDSSIRIEKTYDATVVLIGKPNAGKSTFLNKLLNKDRSIVSTLEGTTRDMVVDYFTLQKKKIKLIDTAGIRRKNNQKDIIESYSFQKSIHAINQSDVVVLIIDAEKGISNHDKKIADVVKNRNKSLFILVNKWDLREEKNWEKYRDRILFLFPHAKNFHLLPISCKTGKNFKNVLQHLNKIIDNLHFTFKTGDLNNLIKEMIFKTPPPPKKGKKIENLLCPSIAKSTYGHCFLRQQQRSRNEKLSKLPFKSH